MISINFELFTLNIGGLFTSLYIWQAICLVLKYIYIKSIHQMKRTILANTKKIIPSLILAETKKTSQS